MRLRSTAVDIHRHRSGADRFADGVSLDSLLVEEALLTQSDAEAIRAHGRDTGLPFEEAAVALGKLDRATLEAARARQADFPLLAPGDPRVDPRVRAAFDTTSATVARYRDLRGALSSRWHADGPNDHHAVALVGLDESVAVAPVAANLAVVSAQLGWRTLLVDGDLHAPAQDALFRLPNHTGLSALLVGSHPDGAVVQPTAIERLSLIATGPVPANAGELLERQPLLGMLDGQLSRQRLVLLSLSMRSQSIAFGSIDTILSGFDGVLVVTHRHRSTLRRLQKLAALLDKNDIPVLGTVIAR